MVVGSNLTIRRLNMIRLGSNEMVFAPNIFRWAMAHWALPKNRKTVLNVMKSWEAPLTDKQWGAVLQGKIPHKIDGESVVIEIDNMKGE